MHGWKLLRLAYEGLMFVNLLKVGASHQDVVARCPSSNAHSANRNVPVHAAPATAPDCDQRRKADTGSATSACARRVLPLAGYPSEEETGDVHPAQLKNPMHKPSTTSPAPRRELLKLAAVATSTLMLSQSAKAAESNHQGKPTMSKVALFVRLEAKPGQETAVANFLAGALPLANAELGTVSWFALRFGPSTFGVFDTFAGEEGRQAHLNGPIAAALMANAAALLSSPPEIEKVDLLAVKMPA